MKRKLNCILLIDDDEPTNFINEMVIKEAGCADKVVAVQSGQAGLDYLRSTNEGAHPKPDLIFLDINMPGMNGWEFLAEYNQLKEEEQARLVVVMLTTSLNPDDAARASQIGFITGFMNKPLTTSMIQDVLEEHFKDWL